MLIYVATNDEEAIDINKIIGQFVRGALKKPGACTMPGEKRDCPDHKMEHHLECSKAVMG